MAAGTGELGRGVHWHMFRWWRQLCFSALFSTQSSPVGCSFSRQPSLGKDSLNTRQEVANPALYSRGTGLWMELSHESLWVCVFAPAAHPALPGQMRKEALKPQCSQSVGEPVTERDHCVSMLATLAQRSCMLLATHEKPYVLQHQGW